MKNLEIIKNKNGGYGIRDLDTGKVIIPAMYEKNQLENINEIIPFSYFSTNYSSDIFVLKGFDIDNNEVCGIYNSITNDFIEVIYEGISLKMHTNADSTTNNEIQLIKDGNKICYNWSMSQDNTSIKRNVKMFTNDNKVYGLMTVDNKVIIPSKYTRREIFDIGDITEIFEGIYLLKDKDDSNKIVGFYDSTRESLKKGTFTSYEIINNALVLKTRIKNNEPRSSRTSNSLISKTYLTLYDSKNGRYICGDYYEREMSEYESDGYMYEGYRTKIYDSLSEINGILLLGAKAFYDTMTGYSMENIICYENNGKIKILNAYDKTFIGYYDVEQRSFNKFALLPAKGLEEYTSLNLYLSDDKKTFYFGNKTYSAEGYSDFIKISDKDFTILLDKNYNFLSYGNKNLKIVEIKPETVKQLGIPVDSEKSVYLIKDNLYTFRKNNSLASKGRHYSNFVKIFSKVVGAVEYEYGICSVEADSIMELDYKLDEIAKREKELSSIIENTFYQDETIMENYPKLVKKKN